MTHARRIKEWLPAAVSIAVVVVTSIYAVTKRSDAAEGIEVANQLATALTDVAARAETGSMSGEDLDTLRQQRADLTRRMEEAGKPGVVVQSLTRLARDTGLSIHEIRPTAKRGADQSDEAVYPLYLIRVGGSYRRIADFMEACEGHRVPARVCGFSVRNAATPEQPNATGLMADITVEAFTSAKSAESSGGQSQD